MMMRLLYLVIFSLYTALMFLLETKITYTEVLILYTLIKTILSIFYIYLFLTISYSTKSMDAFDAVVFKSETPEEMKKTWKHVETASAVLIFVCNSLRFIVGPTMLKIPVFIGGYLLTGFMVMWAKYPRTPEGFVWLAKYGRRT